MNKNNSEKRYFTFDGKVYDSPDEIEELRKKYGIKPVGINKNWKPLPKSAKSVKDSERNPKNYVSKTIRLDEKTYNSLLPNIDKISKEIKDAKLSTGINEKTGEPFYMLNFKELKDANGKLVAIVENEGDSFIIRKSKEVTQAPRLVKL